MLLWPCSFGIGGPHWRAPSPPAAGHGQSPVQHPFFYDPMQMEEALPVMGSSVRLTHSASQQSRMVRACLVFRWSRRELLQLLPRSPERAA